MNVLYEENGAFKVGTVLAESAASLHVEALHGKRAKVKAKDVLLRFEEPAPVELLARAEALAGEIDTEFLWQCCGPEEFGFEELAREYCGRAPSPVEAAGILVKLHSAPIYFHRRGRGRYRAAPPEVLRAALAGLERRRREAERIERWAQELEAGHWPEELREKLASLLYKPERSTPEAKALELACRRTGSSPARLAERCGVLGSSHDYHLGRILFEHFPRGTGFPPDLRAEEPADLPLAEASAFSVDDADTTEIDDAFSLAPLGDDRLRIGVHIAAPALGIAPGSALAAVARERLATVYYPGGKITMLPPEVIERFTLAEGRDCPALSLYFDVRRDDFAIAGSTTRIERVRVAANLRHQALEALNQALAAGQAPAGVAYAEELSTLWRFALALESTRGKPAAPERPEYQFKVEGERVTIRERKRGAPLDKLVAELMIAANSAWGRRLDEHGFAGIYRVQQAGRVRMSTVAAPHEALGTSHYAWLSSPLRRYVDLVNQWQLVALLRGEPPPFARGDERLLAAVHAAEAAHAAYDEAQRRMEHYWCLRWLLQENVAIAAAEVVRENLVRFAGLPLYARVPSLPELPPGTPVELSVAAVDLLELAVRCEFRRRLDS